MNTDDIAARLDNRAGYKLVDYIEVGTPVYRLNFIALVQLRKAFPPIEEFVMRAVNEGFHSTSDISGLLGLGDTTVEGTLSNLIRANLVYERGDHTIALTKEGAAALRDEAHFRPTNQTLAIDFDGLTRQPKWYGNQRLLSPHQAELIGLKLIRGFPPRQPTIAELNPNDVFDVLRAAAGATEETRVLLKVRDIVRVRRLYLRALMLIYKASGADLQVGFAIDGRLSEAHEMAFLRADGIEKLGIRRSIQTAGIKGDSADIDLLPAEVKQATKKVESEARKLKRAAAVARFKVSLAKQNLKNATDDSGKQEADTDFKRAADELRQSEEALAKFLVRPLAVYEHPKILREALSEAESRLLIISPWITRAVVDREFLRGLQRLLERGISVYVGYGIDNESKASDGDNEAIAELITLATKFENFVFCRLGDTHAKVLIKDRDYYVISSFNWLSFKGDPKRTFREEWGNLVGIPEQVDALFNKLKIRFQRGT